MQPYRVIPIDDATADAVRTSLRAPGYGHPAYTELATGYGPCRQCLACFEEGAEKRILFTFDPFSGLEPLPLPGPVFIHERACESYPKDSGFPAQLVHLPLTFNAYARGRRLVEQVYATGDDVAPAIDRLLGDPAVDYIHVRNTEAGCFICRLQRQPAEPSH